MINLANKQEKSHNLKKIKPEDRIFATNEE